MLVKVAGSQGYKEGTPTVVIARDVVFCQKAGAIPSMWGNNTQSRHRPDGLLGKHNGLNSRSYAWLMKDWNSEVIVTESSMLLDWQCTQHRLSRNGSTRNAFTKTEERICFPGNMEHNLKQEDIINELISCYHKLFSTSMTSRIPSATASTFSFGSLLSGRRGYPP